MKPTKFLLILTTLLLPLVAAEAREWSGEIRMTYAEENGLSAFIQAETDSRGDVHLFYTYYKYPDDPPKQPVYQIFDKFGSPIIEPLLFRQFTEVPSMENLYTYDIAVDKEDNIYFLWGYYELYLTKMSFDGDILIPKAQLANFIVLSPPSLNNHPSMSVTDDQHVLVFGEAYDHRPNWQSIHGLQLNQYDPQGNFIDTLFTTACDSIQPGYMRYCYRRDSAGFNHLIITEEYDGGWRMENRYIRLSDDGQIQYDLRLPKDRYPYLNLRDMCLMGSNPYIAFRTSDDTTHVASFDPEKGELHIIYQQQNPREIDIAVLMPFDGHLALVTDFKVAAVDGRNPFIGFVEMTEEGEIIAPLTKIHDGAADWHLRQCYSTPDGTLGIIWADMRYSPTLGELLMRYSPDPEQVDLAPAAFSLPSVSIRSYPNPFNSTTRLQFYPTAVGDYYITITDMLGCTLFTAGYTVGTIRPITTLWDGTDRTGRVLPSGTYLLRVQHLNSFSTQPITLIR